MAIFQTDHHSATLIENSSNIYFYLLSILTLLHSERPKLYTVLAFLSVIGLNYQTKQKIEWAALGITFCFLLWRMWCTLQEKNLFLEEQILSLKSRPFLRRETTQDKNSRERKPVSAQLPPNPKPVLDIHMHDTISKPKSI